MRWAFVLWMLLLDVGLWAQPTALQTEERCGLVGEPALHACIHRRRGEGPTIVLAAGAGQDSRTWTPLLEHLTALGHVVTFDRPGLGRSPALAGERTPTVIADEIHQMLEELGAAADRLVLVGHSMGGVHILRYAERFPEHVVGVLLLDVPPPDFETERLRLLTAEERVARRRALAAGRARAPEVVGRERDGATSEPWRFDGFPAETPLLVVVADAQEFGDLGDQGAHRDLWLQLSARWLELSRRSELIRAAGSGHMIHRQRPRQVVDLVARLARSDGHGSPSDGGR